MTATDYTEKNKIKIHNNLKTRKTKQNKGKIKTHQTKIKRVYNNKKRNSSL